MLSIYSTESTNAQASACVSTIKSQGVLRIPITCGTVFTSNTAQEEKEDKASGTTK